MKMKKTAIFYVLFLLINVELSSQNSFEIEGIYSANLSMLTPLKTYNTYKQNLYHSFGIRGTFILKSNFFITSGIFILNNGTAIENRESPYLIFPDRSGKYHYLNARSISIPVKAGYNFIDNKKFRFGTELGILNGILLKQGFGNKSGNLESDFYNTYMINLTYSLDFGIKIKEKFIFHLRPNIYYQLNENLVNFKLFSYGLAFGISYQLK
jgi:hypothetical protein